MGEKLLQNTEGTYNVRNPVKSSASDIRISINKDKAGMLGVPVHEIEKTIRIAMVGLPQEKSPIRKAKNIISHLPLPGVRKKHSKISIRSM
jgi:multidrug efflux pump subunit AcrB